MSDMNSGSSLGSFKSTGEIRSFRRQQGIHLRFGSAGVSSALFAKNHAVSDSDKNRGGFSNKLHHLLCSVPPPIKSFEDLRHIHHSQQDGTQESIHHSQQDGTQESATSNGRCPAVPSWILDNIKHAMKYSTPTAIQMQAIPILLRGENLMACAPTGSGKTVAFLLPLLCRLEGVGRTFARILVVCPSRELAQQTKREFDLLVGNKKYRSRVLDKTVKDNQNLRRLDLAVSTPMRLIQLCRDQRVSMQDCECLVLDEADRLLDSGFAGQVDEILSYCTRYSSCRLQICLFSATLPDNVLQLADSLMHSDTIRLQIGVTNSASQTIEQSLMFVTKEEGKLLAIRQLVREGKLKPPTLVFVQTKERAQQLFNELVYDGIFVDVIHAERTKSQRDALVEAFRARKIWVLICTDLMARGVDFKGVEMVINYDFPQTATTYIHRIGRTGRAGKAGSAMTFYCMEDLPYLRTIVNVMRQSGCDVPEWMLKISKPNKKDMKHLAVSPLKRKRISTTSGWDLDKKHRKQQAVNRSKQGGS
eukprot:GHVQ01017018.1.p2 GENE.GHVQ01017018.1~~GHVQ01017018.1.p2  ORF type:complete len:532 (-),score=55.45 GHVQ01017018.1:2631-4226(-)